MSYTVIEWSWRCTAIIGLSGCTATSRTSPDAGLFVSALVVLPMRPTICGGVRQRDERRLAVERHDANSVRAHPDAELIVRGQAGDTQ